VWPVWSPGTVSHWTFVPHLYIRNQLSKTCWRHFSDVPTSLTNCFHSTSSENCTAPLWWLATLLRLEINCRVIIIRITTQWSSIHDTAIVAASVNTPTFTEDDVKPFYLSLIELGAAEWNRNYLSENWPTAAWLEPSAIHAQLIGSPLGLHTSRPLRWYVDRSAVWCI